jgi:hypothetical protein
LGSTEGGDSRAIASWWSAPQAVVWMVTRSEDAVDEAGGDRVFEDAVLRTHLRPVQVGRSVPISFDTARVDLLRAACAGRLKIIGRKWGTSEPVEVPVALDFIIGDLDAEDGFGLRASIGAPSSRQTIRTALPIRMPPTPYWRDLYVDAAECKENWPAPVAAPTVTAERTRNVAGEISAQADAPEPASRRDRNGHAIGSPPPEFEAWARTEEEEGRAVIAIDGNTGAWAAMKSTFPTRPPARETVGSWVKTLPEERQAKQGTPPNRGR